VPNPFFGIVPRSSSIGDPTITRAQLLKPYPDYTAVSFYRNNVGTTNYEGLAFSIRQRMSGGLTYSAAYTRSKLTDIASSVFDTAEEVSLPGTKRSLSRTSQKPTART
jgi:hypothetical protein